MARSKDLLQMLQADGREERDLTASRRKGMRCTLKDIMAQRLKYVFNEAAPESDQLFDSYLKSYERPAKDGR